MRNHHSISPKLLAVCGAGISLAQIASGAIGLDGTLDAEYGSAVSVQTVETGFGDNFSELDAAYARIQGGNLYLMLTGNLENNFNKLNIFIDSTAGGQNTIGGSNPPNDNWASKHNGFTFDAGFSADYLFILRNGGTQFDLDYSQVGGGALSFDSFGNVFGGSTQGAAMTGPGANLGFAFGIAFNNSNAAGVLGGNNAANQAAALAVMTGMELVIPLTALGNPANGSSIRISAMINGSNHDYLSNQYLGGLTPPQGNLGGDGLGNFTGSVGGVNLNNFTGDQFFTVVVPEPSSLALLGLGAGAACWLRRRKVA
jgi:PEP-CTERM motif-containing protein